MGWIRNNKPELRKRVIAKSGSIGRLQTWGEGLKTSIKRTYFLELQAQYILIRIECPSKVFWECDDGFRSRAARVPGAESVVGVG